MRYTQLGFPAIPENIRYINLGEITPLSKIDKTVLKKDMGENFKFPPDDNVSEKSKKFEYPKFPVNEYVKELENKYESLKNTLEEFSKVEKPLKPKLEEIVYNPGWTKYEVKEKEGDIFDLDDEEDKRIVETYQVEKPQEYIKIIDVETFVKSPKNTVVLAVCVTSKAFYLYIHPHLIDPDIPFKDYLLSVGEGIVLNHNVKFDSSKFRERYQNKKIVLLDTMSMHISICGMSSKQKLAYKAHSKGKEVGASNWSDKTSNNNLLEVYNHHVKPLDKNKYSKNIRSIFEKASDISEIQENLESLIQYTLDDGEITFTLSQYLIPKYFNSQPSNITLGGHVELNKCILPVISDWYNKINQIDMEYFRIEKEIKKDLKEIADDLVSKFLKGEIKEDDLYEDSFLNQLDWTISKRGKYKGYPSWYRKTKNYTLKSDIAPILLRLYWRGSPLKKSYKLGWVFPDKEKSVSSFYINDGKIPPGYYSKVPHKDGEKYNCGNPLGKDYLNSIENGDLTSDNPKAKDLLKKSKSISYWQAARSRVFSYHPRNVNGSKYIEPTLIVNGTASRRCVESLWLTVPSAKSDVVGSELKGLIRPPKGYKLIGSDFDSQEMKIAAFFADAYKWNEFGSTPLGYTILSGSKEKGTDSHTLLSKEHQLPRWVAKKLNFQMLYLSGISGCAQTIKQYRPDLPDKECKDLAKKVLSSRQGNKQYKNGIPFYSGGTDSDAYNFMINLAERYKLPNHLRHLNHMDTARTPMLGAAISEPISIDNTKDYTTSRCNWTIQSTGVDFLHLFSVILIDLFEKYEIDGYLVLPIHDEIWSCVNETQQELAAECFQIAHFYSWIYLAYRLGFDDFPLAYSLFSEINIDNCLRKEVTESQITPSNDSEVPFGYTL